MMETSISDFHTSLYILEIKNLVFHLPHVRIIWTNHCNNTLREAFKILIANQDVFFHSDYSERVVAILHIKYILNNMASIYLCLLKAFHWTTLVH